LEFDEAKEEDESMGDAKEGADKGRSYCPMVGCPKGDHHKAAGWASFKGLRYHVEEHATGRLHGTIPPEWLMENRLGQ